MPSRTVLMRKTEGTREREKERERKWLCLSLSLSVAGNWRWKSWDNLTHFEKKINRTAKVFKIRGVSAHPLTPPFPLRNLSAYIGIHYPASLSAGILALLLSYSLSSCTPLSLSTPRFRYATFFIDSFFPLRERTTYLSPPLATCISLDLVFFPRFL